MENLMMRPNKWAQPIIRTSLENFHRITPELYRAAQPSKRAMQELEVLGFKSVLNLRAYHSNEDELSGTKIQEFRVPLKTWSIREPRLMGLLQTLQTAPKPLLIHCQHGADRTGFTCALFRIVFQNWTRQEAIEEMQEGGFRFHRIWKSIPRLIQALDADKLRSSILKTD